MKILVIGELGVDKFIYGDCTRLNPEAPTPVFKPKNTHSNMGMVGNVLANLKSLGVDVEMIHQQERIVKTRYVDEKSNYILLRVDEEPELEPLKFSNIQDIELTEYDAIIISDYNKGFLTEEMMEYIMVNSSLSFIDTKRPFGKWIKNATYIKVNESESKNPSHDKFVMGLMKERLIITKGGSGCDLNGMNYPTNTVEVRDVVGAGDTFIAALAAAFIKTREIETSIYFANQCATNVIQKRGVADISDMKIIFDKL
jgi:bifunctional ADP-heptose synthase (sugar kinase/adenylyltransferase)